MNRFKQLGQVEVILAEGGRGDFKIVRSYLDAIGWLLQNKIDFDWLINLSGQDYPTQSLFDLEKRIESSPHDGYMEYFPVDKTQPWIRFTGEDRYFYQYLRLIPNLNPLIRGIISPFKTLINASQPLIRLNLSYGLMLGLKAQSTPFNDTFSCYGGSFFKTLSRACIEYLYSHSLDHPELVSYYERTVIPDESYIQTVLVNSHLFKFCNNNHLYVDFSGSLRHGRPRILTSEDYSNLLSDNIFFARKFDPAVDTKILDQLDQRIFKNYSLE
ncbi:beta-1,6-N-acetylglucosaminyltransferase [Synechococcus sp. PCC 6312]|uniref:beta-1,6-N-acetylglucosaminyltransferase n=1 Tax=Synechococcus sp. (strain ATCC 27167 / PCC 6312) TaxID=195253 RepID=UPI00209DA8C7|nr:beta-1,6-N-acetylglucosaminyltransferase [Synechococcus sp. PCC 6312]